jgi:hypothetical protein
MKAAETACGEYMVCKRERKAAKLFLITFDYYSYFFFLPLKLYQVIYDYFVTVLLVIYFLSLHW